MNITHNNAPITVNNHYYAAPASQEAPQAVFTPEADEYQSVADDEAAAAAMSESLRKEMAYKDSKIANLLSRNQELEEQLANANKELEDDRELRVALTELYTQSESENEELKTANAKLRKSMHEAIDEEDERRIEAYQHRTPELSKEKEERERYELAYMLRNRSEEDQRILLGIGEEADLELHKKRNGLDIIDKQIAEYIAEHGTDLPLFPEVERLKEEIAARDGEATDTTPWAEDETQSPVEPVVEEKTVVRTWDTASRTYTEYSDGTKSYVVRESPEEVNTPAEELNIEDYIVEEDEEEPAPVEEAPKSFLNVKPKEEEVSAPTSLLNKLKRVDEPKPTPSVFGKPAQEEVEETQELVEKDEIIPTPTGTFSGFGNAFKKPEAPVAPAEEVVTPKPVFNPFGR